MFQSKIKIADFLYTSSLLIENAISDLQINMALATYGYPTGKLLAGKKLYDEAVALDLSQKTKSGEKVAATHEFKTLWAEAERTYMKTLKVARVAFWDIAKADKGVMLEGIRKRSFLGWLGQARAFYTNILNDSELLNIIAGYGYSREKLEGELALLGQVEAASLRQQKAIGDAQQAIQDRDQKLNELALWTSHLRAVAKVALSDTPQLLEALGIVVRSKK